MSHSGDAPFQDEPAAYGIADIASAYSRHQNGPSNTCMCSGNLTAGSIEFKGANH